MITLQRTAGALLAIAAFVGLSALAGSARAQSDFLFFESGPGWPRAPK